MLRTTVAAKVSRCRDGSKFAVRVKKGFFLPEIEMHSTTVDSATMRAVSVNAGGSRVACCASEPSSPIVDYSKDYHIGEPMLPR